MLRLSVAIKKLSGSYCLLTTFGTIAFSYFSWAGVLVVLIGINKGDSLQPVHAKEDGSKWPDI